MDFRFETPLGPRVVIQGRERDYFSGTGYLGLQNHPQVLAAAVECLQHYGFSTGTSRGGYGEHVIYDRLEQELTSFFGVERALYYASGYLGAFILAQGLTECYERIYLDEWSHFSIRDAAAGMGKPIHSYRHNDPNHLAITLEQTLFPGERPLVLSDGVFPISGEVARLPDLLGTVEPYNGWVCLDDAHAVGVIGPHGRGSADYYGITPERYLISGTLSKALGGYGGFIVGNRVILAELERNSKVPVAASPPPLVAAAASAKAVEIARTQPELRDKLRLNIQLARQGLLAAGWDLMDSPTPILCLPAQRGIDLARLKDQLFEAGICVAHVTKYSSTPPGGALRIAIFASHTEEQIKRLVKAIKENS